MSLAEKLAALRKQKGLTQMELAAYLSECIPTGNLPVGGGCLCSQYG